MLGVMNIWKLWRRRPMQAGDGVRFSVTRVPGSRETWPLALSIGGKGTLHGGAYQ